MNNIVRVENLQGCESLRKLDLTMNFIPASALPSFANLSGLYMLRELHLLGNPCQSWEHCRQYIIMTLPQLQTLVGLTLSPFKIFTMIKQSTQNIQLSRLETKNKSVTKVQTCNV